MNIYANHNFWLLSLNTFPTLSVQLHKPTFFILSLHCPDSFIHCLNCHSKLRPSPVLSFICISNTFLFFFFYYFWNMFTIFHSLCNLALIPLFLHFSLSESLYPDDWQLASLALCPALAFSALYGFHGNRKQLGYREICLEANNDTCGRRSYADKV